MLSDLQHHFAYLLQLILILMNQILESEYSGLTYLFQTAYSFLIAQLFFNN